MALNRRQIMRKVLTEQRTRIFKEFFRTQSSSGIILLTAALVAFLWAGSPWSYSYHALWQQEIGFTFGGLDFQKTVLHWINDGLMAIFFFLVGLEIKRELLMGELSTPRKAALPIAAALGGMIVPAVLYISINSGTDAARGWGIPMATDIAFSLGVLALASSAIPVGIKIFLTAFAIVDDLGAVLVIAFFYTAGLSWVSLSIAGFIFTIMIIMNAIGVKRGWIYLILSILLWIALLKSGVHATIAGVLAAMTIPTTSRQDGSSLLTHWEHKLQPWVSFGIMPLFALANSGVTIEGDILNAIGHPVTIGIVLGLVAGKLIGLLLFSRLAVGIRIASLPSGATWNLLFGVSLLGGIGFTMSLFIAGLAFGSSPLLTQAKIGILSGSLIAGVTGWIVLRLIVKNKNQPQE